MINNNQHGKISKYHWLNIKHKSESMFYMCYQYYSSNYQLNKLNKLKQQNRLHNYYHTWCMIQHLDKIQLHIRYIVMYYQHQTDKLDNQRMLHYKQYMFQMLHSVNNSQSHKIYKKQQMWYMLHICLYIQGMNMQWNQNNNQEYMMYNLYYFNKLSNLMSKANMNYYQLMQQIGNDQQHRISRWWMSNIIHSHVFVLSMIYIDKESYHNRNQKNILNNQQNYKFDNQDKQHCIQYMLYWLNNILIYKLNMQRVYKQHNHYYCKANKKYCHQNNSQDNMISKWQQL